MIVLIVPCYNETLRIDLNAFIRASGHDLKFLFVDDGSADGTFDLITKTIGANSLNCRALRLPVNQGKGEAIRYAMLELQKTDWWDAATWCGFWDADLATPLNEIPNFLAYSDLYTTLDSSLNKQVDAVWGSRIYRLGSRIIRSSLRHYLGRVFATFVHHLLHVEAYDTQCGAKLFRKTLIKNIFAEPFISRWIFDVEILLRLEGAKIIEYPLQKWQDIPGSKIKVFREIFRVFFEILKIRKKYIRSKSKQSH